MFVPFQIMFKKQPDGVGAPLYPNITPDPRFRKDVFDNADNYIPPRPNREQSKLGKWFENSQIFLFLFQDFRKKFVLPNSIFFGTLRLKWKFIPYFVSPLKTGWKERDASKCFRSFFSLLWPSTRFNGYFRAMVMYLKRGVISHWFIIYIHYSSTKA